MLSYIGWAALLTSITVMVHGICTVALMYTIRGISRRHAGRPIPKTDHLLLLAGLVVALLGAHCLEALAWAVYYVRSGGLADMEEALYFSLASYATIGYGDVVMKTGERLVGTVEGLVGTFMCGWSVALLVSVIQLIAKAMHVPTHGEAAKSDGRDGLR